MRSEPSAPRPPSRSIAGQHGAVAGGDGVRLAARDGYEAFLPPPRAAFRPGEEPGGTWEYFQAAALGGGFGERPAPGKQEGFDAWLQGSGDALCVSPSNKSGSEPCSVAWSCAWSPSAPRGVIGGWFGVSLTWAMGGGVVRDPFGVQRLGKLSSSWWPRRGAGGHGGSLPGTPTVRPSPGPITPERGCSSLEN